MYKNFNDWNIYEGLADGSGRSEKNGLLISIAMK